MKIDRFRLRKSTSEVPPECLVLIEKLRQCSRVELLAELSQIKSWIFGKCELYHWIPVLDLFDTILEEAAASADCDNTWALQCDSNYNEEQKKLLLWTLHFTTLLIEHSFSRHLYNSMEHLLTLLNSYDMTIVLAVLNLLYMFSKRSNFITRLGNDKRDELTSRLHYLAESWGGKVSGFGMAGCCIADNPIPPSATTVHFEFCKDHITDVESLKYSETSTSSYIHVENIHKLNKTPADIMKSLTTIYFVPPDREMFLYTHVRLAYHYTDFATRVLCVQARLQALSILAYSNAVQDTGCTILYDGLLEELVELVQLDGSHMVDIRSAALRTLTSIIHLDRVPHFPKKVCSRLSSIIEATGANQYHGFLPTLVRNCISCLTKAIVVKTEPPDEIQDESPICVESISYPHTDTTAVFPLPLATSLFSFLYHLASYEAGGEALVACGVLESLLQVISWQGVELEHITFVTRAVRVIDLITNMDMQAFHSYGGLQIFINRLDNEVQICRPYQGYEFKPVEIMTDQSGPSDLDDEDINFIYECQINPENFGKTCLPQRAALLKSMLNFLKKAIQDVVFAESTRQVMEGILPSALKLIVANAEYYGASLFLLATDLVTVYVFQDASVLNILQDNGLADVVLYALLNKDIPITREVLGSVPNVFSALCLNARGLQAFTKYKPFERVMKVLLTPQYLSAMRRRRSSDPLGDTASNFGNAMDELMRHQPSLKVDAIAAIVKLLNDVCQLGSDSRYVCWRPHGKSEPANINIQPVINRDVSSDEEDEEDDETSTSSHNTQAVPHDTCTSTNNEKTPIPLIDYIHNIMKFVDSLLSNNSTDDHCKEFVQQNGLHPLLRLLALPNLPVDSPVTACTHAVASVCKTILNVAHEPRLFREAMVQVYSILQILNPLFLQLDTHNVSILLEELASSNHPESAFQNVKATPILHALAAIHGYVVMFVHVCRTGQNEVRSVSLSEWGSDLGLQVLKELCKLYKSLVWESTLLLAICTERLTYSDFDIGQSFLEELSGTPEKVEVTNNSSEMPSTSSGTTGDNVEAEVIHMKPTSQQLKYIKPLLGASSRLGRALAELFGLLVKVVVGATSRQRRVQSSHVNAIIPSLYANNIAIELVNLVAYGLDYKELPKDHIVKYKLTFLICSAGFASTILFDEKRFPYHLMLHKFVMQRGMKAFFNTFQWVLSIQDTVEPIAGLNHPELPEGAGEFLDAWLILLEKLVNTKALLESPHYGAGRTANASQASLKNILIFNPLRFLIQIHKFAFESVLWIWGKPPLPEYGMRMCDSMLTILRHIIKADKMIRERLHKGDEKVQSFFGRPEINEDFLDQLIEMGFSRESALEAASQTLSVEEATDYLLFNRVQQQRRRSAGMEIDVEDDQVLQAIALSLGDTGPIFEKNDDLHCIVPITDKRIVSFLESALETSLFILREYPDTIYKVCELMGIIMKRGGPKFRDGALKYILDEINRNCGNLLKTYYFRKGTEQLAKELCRNERAYVVGNYAHLFTLFFEIPTSRELRIPCALTVYHSSIIGLIVKMVSMAAQFMEDLNKPLDFMWLTPLLMLLDVFERVSVNSQRKYNMHCATNRVWKWYDLTTGKWNPYSQSNNKLINEAYFNGEATVRISCGRRRYTITFYSMLQCNEETGSNRAVSMTLLNVSKNYWKYPPTHQLKETMANDVCILTEKETLRCLPIKGLCHYEIIELIQSSVKMLRYPVKKDVFHSILRFSIKYTRDFRVAKAFIDEGGVKCLLKLKSNSGFSGYGTMLTVLIRHLLEEPNTLVHSFEKVIRGKTLDSFPPSHRELIYLFRHLEPAITRCQSTFFEVAKAILRVDTSIFQNVEDVDGRLPVCSEPCNGTQYPALEDKSTLEVIYDLLNALLLPIEESTQVIRKQGNSASTARELIHLKVSDLFGSGVSSSDILNIDSQDDVRMSPKQNEKDAKATPTPVFEKPLLAKHAILKILADAVVSYGAVAKLITDFTYKENCCAEITEECTVLAFMFDHLLPVTKLSDRDSSMMCRVLIAAIASANHCPEAQCTLVNEVKSALTRALAMSESYKKHNQIQLMTQVITTIVENCPPSNQLRILKNQPLNGQINNIVKLMLKKGVFTDLGKLSQFMDLSSPLFALTMNSSLKPIEALTRIVNQPLSGNSGNKSNKRAQNDDAAVTQSGTTSTEATNAQGEEAAEDCENTEHDVSAVASSLEEGANDQVSTNDHNEEARTYSIVATVRTMDVDEDVNVAYEAEADATEEIMSTDSGDSESNTSDQDVDDDNDENDGDEDDMDDGDDNDDSNDGAEPDVLMVQYTDHELDDTLRMIRWNETGFAVPLEDITHWNRNVSNGHAFLISSRQNGESGASTNRNAHNPRTRRYQYVNGTQRGANPPVILQRLLGPVAQNLSISTNELMNSATRDSGRVMVMDNFGMAPTNEEQIDFVDQSGFLFGPSLLATLNHLPSVLYWWNEEYKLIEEESAHDLATVLSNKMVINLLIQRNIELSGRFKKKDGDKTKHKSSDKAKRRRKVSSPKTYVSTHQQTVEGEEGLPPENDSGTSDCVIQLDEETQSEGIVDFVCTPNAESTVTMAQTLRSRLLTEIREEELRAAQDNVNGEEVANNTSNRNSPSDTANYEGSTRDGQSESNEDSSMNETFIISDSDTEEALSEIERLVSEGLAERQRLEPYLPAEPFEEPSDTSINRPLARATNPIAHSSVCPRSRDHPYLNTQRPQFRSFSPNVAIRSEPFCPLVPYSHSGVVGRRWPFRNFIPASPSHYCGRQPLINLVHSARIPRILAIPPTAVLTYSSDPIEIDSNSSTSNDDVIFVGITNGNSDNISVPTNCNTTCVADIHTSTDTTAAMDISASISTTTINTITNTTSTITNTRSINTSTNAISTNTTPGNATPTDIIPTNTSTNTTLTTTTLTTATLTYATSTSTTSINATLTNTATTNTVTTNTVATNTVATNTVATNTDATNLTGINSNIDDDDYTNIDDDEDDEEDDDSNDDEEDDDDDEDGDCVCTTAAQHIARPEGTRDHGVQCNESDSSNNSADVIIIDNLPDGVDPSFFAALPAEIQREVLDQFHIMSSPVVAVAGPSTAGDHATIIIHDVNPEFLAALPPSLQEEVLSQQRMEQERQASTRTNPNEPLDAGLFFSTLQPSLRTMILSDMEESQIAALPPELAAEAQYLRRDWELRNRHLIPDRYIEPNLSALMRHSARGPVVPRIQTHLPGHSAWDDWENCVDITAGLPFCNSSKLRGRPLLDQEALACLLLLLFVDDSKFSTLRLHRVIRNLCYHGPTRDWIMKALLSIVQRSILNSPIDENSSRVKKDPSHQILVTSNSTADAKNLVSDANWLTIRREAALGCRSEVLILSRSTTGKWTERTNSATITIHPQASPAVCKNAMDLMKSLTKVFPSCLLPLKLKPVKEDKNKPCCSSQPKPLGDSSHSKPKDDKDERNKPSTSSSQPKPQTDSQDFWDVLIRLDSSFSKKGKGLAKNNTQNWCGENDSVVQYDNFDQSPLGQLLHILEAPVVYYNVQLTDKLLHLVSTITDGLPEMYALFLTSKHKSKLTKYESIPVSESCLMQIISIVKNKACSEEGLEDATSLLLNLAKHSFVVCTRILNLLIDCAMYLGRNVKVQITNMSFELKKLRKVRKRTHAENSTPGTSRGTVIDRFTNEQVVIASTSKPKSSCDLQLGAMAPFTCKAACQMYLLKILRAIVGGRDIIKRLLLNEYTAEDRSLDELNISIDPLCTQLEELECLWDSLSSCLLELENSPDEHAVLVLQPAVEAFFLVHSSQEGVIDKESLSRPQTAQTTPAPTSSESSNVNLPSNTVEFFDYGITGDSASKPNIPIEQQKFLNFADKHHKVLNQILRQNTSHLTDGGPLSVLVEHSRVLDFDIKRRYFKTELERMDQGVRRDEAAIHVHRSSVFEDSFRELFRRTPEEWKQRFYIVFDEEEGQDAGGLLREWYLIISKEIFNPMYALFTTSPGDRVTYMINSSSHYNSNHLCYYRFVGRVIAKAIYDNKLLECYFTRSIYKHILGKPVTYNDMASEDYSFYKGLVFLLENNVKDLDYDLTFCTEINEFGVTETRDLIPDGHKIAVTEDNKMDYIRLSCQMKTTGAIRQQLQAFLQGFYDIIPKRLISIFNEQELELMISGLPNIDIDELKAHTEYHKYNSNSLQIQWFWRALRSFDQADRAKFIQFVTGTSKVPLQGFEFLEGMNGVQKFQIHRDDRSTDRLPSAHTCFNQLDLPVYESSAKLRENLLKAINECSEGFGFA